MKIRNAKEILEDLKKVSQIIVDLGYSAILQNERELALEAIVMKRKINELSYEIRLSIIYASKSAWTTRKEIEQLASILQVGVAAKEISDGVEDLIAIVLRGEGAHPVLRTVFGRRHVMKILKIPEEVEKISIQSLEIPEEVEIVYIRRDDNLVFPPIKKNFVLRKGDILLINGPSSKIEDVRRNINKR